MKYLNEQDGKYTVLMEETRENWIAMNQMLSYAFSFSQNPDPSSKPESYERSDPHTRIATYSPDGTMIAGLQVVWEDIYLKGRPIRHGGIKAVASQPWSRRQGNVGMTLVGACRHMLDQGAPVSSLYPFSFAFYSRYGWELGQRSISYRIPMAGLKPFAKAGGRTERMSLKPEGSQDPDTGFERLKALYGRFARTIGASFVRTPGWWRHVTLESLDSRKFVGIYADEQGEDRGYITYSLNRDKNELYAYELVYDSPEALKGLLSFVYSHDSMVADFTWKAPWNTDLQILLQNPRVEAKAESGMMFRVVDVLAALRHCAEDYTGPDFTMRVTDPHLDWNNNLYSITGRGVERVATDSGAEADIVLDIDRLSQAVCGYASLSSLVAAGLAETRNGLPDGADSLFIPEPGYVPYMNDNF